MCQLPLARMCHLPMVLRSRLLGGRRSGSRRVLKASVRMTVSPHLPSIPRLRRARLRRKLGMRLPWSASSRPAGRMCVQRGTWRYRSGRSGRVTTGGRAGCPTRGLAQSRTSVMPGVRPSPASGRHGPSTAGSRLRGRRRLPPSMTGRCTCRTARGRPGTGPAQVFGRVRLDDGPGDQELPAQVVQSLVEPNETRSAKAGVFVLLLTRPVPEEAARHPRSRPGGLHSALCVGSS